MENSIQTSTFNHEAHEGHEEGFYIILSCFRDLRVLRGEKAIGRVQLEIAR
jgi:hypothetical protein